MFRFMAFVFIGVIVFAFNQDGALSNTSACFCLSAFVFLFWGAGLLFGGDGLVTRYRNRDNLSTQEKQDLEFLRGYSSRIDWMNICYRAWRTEKSEVLRKQHQSSLLEEGGKLIDRFNELKTAVSKGTGSECFKNMAITRISKIEAHEREQSALNYLE